MVIAAIAAAAVFFLFGLGAVMLYRFALHGEIDLQGLAAFGSLVLLPMLQHFQNMATGKGLGCLVLRFRLGGSGFRVWFLGVFRDLVFWVLGFMCSSCVV